jgi:hypothetical protein
MNINYIVSSYDDPSLTSTQNIPFLTFHRFIAELIIDSVFISHAKILFSTIKIYVIMVKLKITTFSFFDYIFTSQCFTQQLEDAKQYISYCVQETYQQFK